MKITVAIVDKGGKEKLYSPLIEHYGKLIKSYSQIDIIDVFDKKISKAQDVSAVMAQKSYSDALQPYLSKNTITIALDPSSKEVDSEDFALLLKDKGDVTFLIGGAYGFERDFIKKCNHSISFGKITLSHKLVKVVLLEQIFRGLSINSNHPYHK
ncbi:MAG: 23S rRNA (pseudouridine(1915)-N(3))-methyltransferase RlmH [Sulfurovaceae bacterium]|nr:23S rRNA (pseudouridine(1915)-N(3))-methyltransferase RlmH [Sulfurovaceae bacterium]